MRYLVLALGPPKVKTSSDEGSGKSLDGFTCCFSPKIFEILRRRIVVRNLPTGWLIHWSQECHDAFHFSSEHPQSEVSKVCENRLLRKFKLFKDGVGLIGEHLVYSFLLTTFKLRERNQYSVDKITISLSEVFFYFNFCFTFI